MMRAARCTSRPTYPSGVNDGSPVCRPMRTRTATPSGQGWAARARCASTTANTASVARAKATKKLSPWVSTSWPFHSWKVARSRCRHSASTLAECRHLLEQARGPFDVGEEHGDRSCWEAARRGLTLPTLGCVFRRRSNVCSCERLECLFQGQGKGLHMLKALLWVLGKGFEYDMLKRR